MPRLRICDKREPAGSVRIDLEIARVETLGNSKLITVRGGDCLLAIVVGAREKFVERQVVGVTFDMQQAHLFDATTGLTLLSGVPTG